MQEKQMRGLQNSRRSPTILPANQPPGLPGKDGKRVVGAAGGGLVQTTLMAAALASSDGACTARVAALAIVSPWDSNLLGVLCITMYCAKV